MTDKVKVLMQLFCLVVFLRLDEGYSVSSETLIRPSKQALNFVNNLLTEMSVKNFVVSEITYLASIYDVLYFESGKDLLFTEKFDSDFSYKIRQLIGEVSRKIELEFDNSDKLYELLYEELKATEILPYLFSDKESDFIKKIRKENPEIYNTVKESLKDIFGKDFPSIETAFISLEFLEKINDSNAKLLLRAALVSDYGRISCEFIIGKLRKNFPFLKEIDLISNVNHATSQKYDVVFTTEKELEYLYINPILDQNNLENIRVQLRLIQNKIKRLPAFELEEHKKNLNASDLFLIGGEMLESFEILPLLNKPELKDTIKQIVKVISPQNKDVLVPLIEERAKKTHLAIPETNIALLHAAHSSIKRPIFKIFDLSQPIEGVAMDHQAIQIGRILLLLSSSKVPEYVSFLLGKISSSIIENNLYTRIYDSGNYKLISELLSEIIIEAIKNYGE
ncbi:Mannitol operon activator BglG family [Lactococcus lactis subsp. lactis]|nr:Mannitol operon activator BglG family [Lactococcus lactis subsp. lactis]